LTAKRQATNPYFYILPPPHVIITSYPSIEKLKQAKESRAWDEAATVCQEAPNYAPAVEYCVAENNSGRHQHHIILFIGRKMVSQLAQHFLFTKEQ